jgi:ABC-type glycerol-3-phosphate transport system substrate-binding protein
MGVAMAGVLLVAACGGGGGGGGTQAPGGSGGGASGSTITVQSLWGGAEETAFRAVLDDFKAKKGVTANYVAQRTDYATVLRTAIQGGNPPDVAIIPGIGFLRSFAADNSIKSFEDLGITADLSGNYAPGLLEVGQVDGKQYGVVVKLNSKSTMFYRPDIFKENSLEPPTTWDEFKSVVDELQGSDVKPLGLGAKDSWTLTDWFENVYIRQAGPEAYDKLFSAEGDWNDPSVKEAIAAMQEVLTEDNVVGGINGALGAGFVDGIGQVFKAEPDAAMYYEGGFVYGIALGDVNEELKWGETIEWFDFPSFGDESGLVTYGGDVIAALTDKPGVKEFMEYMTTAEAGTAWAKGGTIISPVKGVATDVYPNESAKKEAEQVANATAVRFDGSDLLPAGGPDLGALLQSAIKGDDVDALLSDFQNAVKLAWEDE